LHSHDQKYPGWGFDQNEVTVYHNKDDNDVWLVKDVRRPPQRMLYATPLKITHAADCNSTMELQLSTTAASDLTVAGTLSASGVDLVSRLLVVEAALQPRPDDSLWDFTNMNYDSSTNIVTKSISTNAYDSYAYTKSMVTKITWTRPADYLSSASGHTRIYLLTDKSSDSGRGSDWVSGDQDAAFRLLSGFGSGTQGTQVKCNTADSVDYTNTLSGEEGQTFSVGYENGWLYAYKGATEIARCDADGATGFYAGLAQYAGGQSHLLPSVVLAMP